jgi:hypothetical protein
MFAPSDASAGSGVGSRSTTAAIGVEVAPDPEAPCDGFVVPALFAALPLPLPLLPLPLPLDGLDALRPHAISAAIEATSPNVRIPPSRHRRYTLRAAYTRRHGRYFIAARSKRAMRANARR